MDKRGAGEEKSNRSILERLRAALLWSFKGQHDKKIVCMRGVPGVIGTLGKANSHLDPTQTELGIVPPRCGGS